MSGSGYQKRQHADAVRAAKMRREGCTNAEIADATGLDIKVVPARVLLGERLLSLTEDAQRAEAPPS